MKRVFFIHFSFLVSFLFFISLFNSWLSLSFWPFWLGGLLGNFFPEIDNLIYIFFVSPQELTSQRVIYLLKKGSFIGAIKLLAATKEERKNLIFHSIAFTLVLFLLLFWLVTSSGSIFAKGIVFAMLIHLLTGELISRKYPVWYTVIGFGILIVLGIAA